MLQNAHPIEIDIAIEIGIGCYEFDDEIDFERIVSLGSA